MLSGLQLADSYHHTAADDEETAEYVVPVAWISTRPREQAIRKKCLFANQNSACKLRNQLSGHADATSSPNEGSLRYAPRSVATAQVTPFGAGCVDKGHWHVVCAPAPDHISVSPCQL